MAGVSATGFMMLLSAEEATQAEEQLKHKRESAMELDLTIKKLALSMEGWQTKEEKLVGCQVRVHRLFR